MISNAKTRGSKGARISVAGAMAGVKPWQWQGGRPSQPDEMPVSPLRSRQCYGLTPALPYPLPCLEKLLRSCFQSRGQRCVMVGLRSSLPLSASGAFLTQEDVPRSGGTIGQRRSCHTDTRETACTRSDSDLAGSSRPTGHAIPISLRPATNGAVHTLEVSALITRGHAISASTISCIE